MSPFDAWTQLETNAEAALGRSTAALFQSEPARLQQLTFAAAGLEVDLSKQPWSLTDFDQTLELARVTGVEDARSRLFAGDVVNASEGRSAQHMALRAPGGAQMQVQGQVISPEVETGRERMRAFAEGVRTGKVRGADGQEIKAVLHIGIGGSDLGPRLIWEALRPLNPRIDLRFVANVDPSELAFALAGLEPASTLVVVVSKTFTTQETLTNAEAARVWLREALGPAADSHLIAVTAAPEQAMAFGTPQDQIFAFWDWVGGRYSLWSAVGLSCAIALGPDVFEALLKGAAGMDTHFLSAPLNRNLPVVLALAHIFNRNGMRRPARAVIPYSQRLRLFPAFLQQLEMESNGKRVSALGAPLTRGSATTVFGDAGTNGQHAFFQALHQGTDVVPVDFVAVARPREGDLAAHQKLLANVIAQAEALMVGRPEEAVRQELVGRGMEGGAIDTLSPQRTFPGNRPSSFILMDHLTPEALGALIALYEHKVFVEGAIWGLNSFDQWGVELGKTLAAVVLPELTGGASKAHDPSTAALIGRLRS